MKDKIHHILERFSDKSHSLMQLVKEDPEFLSICKDYDICVNALRYWKQSEEPEAETFDVGIDAGTPVSNKYRIKNHYAFSGKLDKVIVRLTG